MTRLVAFLALILLPGAALAQGAGPTPEQLRTQQLELHERDLQIQQLKQQPSTLRDNQQVQQLLLQHQAAQQQLQLQQLDQQSATPLQNQQLLNFQQQLLNQQQQLQQLQQPPAIAPAPPRLLPHK